MARWLLCAIPVLLLCAFAAAADSSVASSSNVISPEVEARVDALLKQLTPEEKCELLGGVDGFYTKPVERLKISRLKFMDGPLGPRNDGPTVAYPGGIVLAATWNTELATREAAAMGNDTRARGGHVLLGPAVNIYRVPTCGRNFEYFGEDPYLASRMAVAYIRALQGEGVAACIKHYAVNNQETNRWSINVAIDERALHEIYLPAFRAAVQEAGVWSIMSAYNRVNGPYCTANDYLQNAVLRTQWGFRGLVMSDWGATHETLNCMYGGLDLEMPSGNSLNPSKILPLIGDGRVSQAVLDEKVRRLLRLAIQMEFFDRPQKPEGAAPNTPESEAAALEVAREGIVLLKNTGILPLDATSEKRVVLLGQKLEHHGGGSAWTPPTRTIGIQEGLSSLMAGSEIASIQPDLSKQMKEAKLQGSYLPTEQTKGQVGLVAQYFTNVDLRGEPAVTRVEEKIDHDWGSGAPVQGVGPSKFSVRWTGRIKPEKSGYHAFFVRGDDGFRVKLDGKVIGQEWHDQGATTRRYIAKLEAGKVYDVVVEYFNDLGLAEMRFGWGPRPELFTPAQREQVRAADTVIVCAGFRGGNEGEGSDRTYSLPEDQSELVQGACELNPRTIVVLNTGGGIDMNPFIDSASAVVQAFYPGQMGGQALAEILTGKVNPSGRLPITLEQKWEDTPAFGNFPGSSTTVEYRESIYVGYRHFDHSNIEPRFPFGFGLSYTTFGLKSARVLDDSPNGVRVAVDVTNTGKVAGAQVVQAYVAAATPLVPRAVRELKAFSKIALAPGETKTLTLHLPGDAFARYDIASHAWKTDPGEYSIQIGDSSRNLPLKVGVRR